MFAGVEMFLLLLSRWWKIAYIVITKQGSLDMSEIYV
jgi:UDP-N-acetylglucosamine:LPS N-acetylglucosamine transferase